MIGAIVFISGGAFQTFTVGFRSMVFGRIISGFGVGFLSYVLASSFRWHRNEGADDAMTG